MRAGFFRKLGLLLWLLPLAAGTPGIAGAAGPGAGPSQAAPRVQSWEIDRAPSTYYRDITGVDDFKVALSIVLNRMVDSYHKGEKAPLRVDVMDVSRVEIDDFFRKIARATAEYDSLLGVGFSEHARINGQDTAACFVKYEGYRRQQFLAGYEASGLFTRQEILYFLAAHEFGHCMVSHQESLGRSFGLSGKDEELVADQVAVGFFLINGQENAARHVVQFNRDDVEDELHAHADALQAYFDAFKAAMTQPDSRLRVTSMLDLLNLAVGKDDLPKTSSR